MQRIIERLRLTGAIIVGGFAIHGALVACGAGSSSDPTPSAKANPAEGGGGGGGGGEGTGGGSGVKIELNAKDDEGTVSGPGDVSLAGQAGLPANATAAYLQIRVPDSSGTCGDSWTIGGKGVSTTRTIGEDEYPVSYHQIWIPLDASQTVTVGAGEPEKCSSQVRVQVLGWLTP